MLIVCCGKRCVQCVGPSMLPTLKEDGDVVIVQNLDHSKSFFGRLLFNHQVDPMSSASSSPGWKRSVCYKKGDVVVSHCKDELEKVVCKRIAAVEGERISYRGNGELQLLCALSGAQTAIFH